MKNYKSSDYAINKFSKNIVYRYANQIKEVTLEEFLADNPSNTSEQFEQLKKISDEIYLQQITDENAQTAKNISLSDNIATPSPEGLFFDAFDIAQRRKEARVRLLAIFSCLTEVQRRRLHLHKIKGYTTREIAEMENVSFSKVAKSIRLAMNKINNILNSGF